MINIKVILRNIYVTRYKVNKLQITFKLNIYATCLLPIFNNSFGPYSKILKTYLLNMR